jgi:hypothetical protein
MTKTKDGSSDELLESSASSTRRHLVKNDENTPPINPTPSKKKQENTASAPYKGDVILENVEPEVVGSTSAAKKQSPPPKKKKARHSDTIKREYKIPVPEKTDGLPFFDVVEVFKPLDEDKVPSQAARSSDRQDECPLCKWSPCVLEHGLYDLLTEPEYLDNYDYVRANAKSIRFDMYRKSTHFMYGPMRKGQRMKLPTCVTTQIHDIAMEDDANNYVGFKESEA